MCIQLLLLSYSWIFMYDWAVNHIYFAISVALLHVDTLVHPTKSTGVRQSKITTGPVWDGLGGKVLRKRDGQIGPVSPFSPRSSPLTSKIFYSGVRQSKITKGLALQHRFNRIIAFWKSSTYVLALCLRLRWSYCPFHPGTRLWPPCGNLQNVRVRVIQTLCEKNMHLDHLNLKHRASCISWWFPKRYNTVKTML